MRNPPPSWPPPMPSLQGVGGIADGGPAQCICSMAADAHTDKVPVLAITGQVKLKDVGTNAKQYLNQLAHFFPGGLQ